MGAVHRLLMQLHTSRIIGLQLYSIHGLGYFVFVRGAMRLVHLLIIRDCLIRNVLIRRLRTEYVEGDPDDCVPVASRCQALLPDLPYKHGRGEGPGTTGLRHRSRGPPFRGCGPSSSNAITHLAYHWPATLLSLPSMASDTSSSLEERCAWYTF